MLKHRKLRTHRHLSIMSTLVTAILFSSIYILPRFAYYIRIGNIIEPKLVRLGLFSRIGQALFLSINLHILLRSLQMYLMICHPMKGIAWLKKRNVYIILAAVWGLTLAIPLLTQIYFEILIYKLDRTRLYYQYRSISLQFTRIFSIFLGIFAIVVLIMLIFAYAKVYTVASKTAREIRKLSIGRSRSDSNIPKLRRRSKAMCQILTIYSFYIAFWMPFLVIIIYSQFLRHYQRNQSLQERLSLDYALRTLQYIAFLFPAILPILFGIFTADIYRALIIAWRSTIKAIASEIR